MNPIVDTIKALFKPAADLIDELHTSEDERLTAQRALAEVISAVLAKVLDYEARIIEAQAAIIKAEAASDSWLTKTWRPLAMMVFLGMVVSWWFGYTPERATEALVLELFGLIKIGLGGYVVGRSVEKVAPAVLQLFKGVK